MDWSLTMPVAINPGRLPPSPISPVCCDGDFRIYDLAGVEVTGQNGSLNGNYIVVANGESVVVNVK